MTLVFEFLADRPDDVTQVLDWWHGFWGERMGDLDTYRRQFEASLGSQELPLDIVALLDGQLAGTAALKEHEMREIYPDYRYWLGSIFVNPALRGQGIATRLASHVVQLARERQLPQIYLQTTSADGGIYATLGWQPLHELSYRGDPTLVMIKRLDQ